jgi:hypothetical protein
MKNKFYKTSNVEMITSSPLLLLKPRQSFPPVLKIDPFIVKIVIKVSEITSNKRFSYKTKTLTLTGSGRLSSWKDHDCHSKGVLRQKKTKINMLSCSKGHKIDILSALVRIKSRFDMFHYISNGNSKFSSSMQIFATIKLL